MNITIVAFLDEYWRRDDRIHGSEFKIIYPETPEEAAVQYQELLLQGEEDDHKEWEIKVLFDGRENDSDEEVKLKRQIEAPGNTALNEAVRRRREKERRRSEERKARMAREEQALKDRRESEDRANYERLRKKYEVRQ